MENEVIKVVSYIRESTIEQSYNGHRPNDQRRIIKQYCQKHNFEIVREFEDSGGGGNIKKRPEFIAMIDYTRRQKDIPFIIIDEMSRYFRNAKNGLGYFDDLAEYKIFVLDTEIDYSPREYLEKGEIPIAQWKSRANALVDAEYELRRTKLRVKSGYDQKSNSGMYVGPLAFGMKWKDVHKKYVEYHPTESPMVKEVFKLYLTGQFGFTKLAKRLNEAGFTRTEIERKKEIVGGSRVFNRFEITMPFTMDTVRKILTNKSYIGRQNTGKHLRLLSIDENKMPITLTPLILEDDFNRVQEIIQQNTRGGSATGHKETSRQKKVFLLQGVGHSGVNGSKLHGATDTTGQKVPCRRYFPSTNKAGTDEHIPSMRADEVEEKIIELMKFVKIRGVEQIEKILREVVETSTVQKKMGSPSTINFIEKSIKMLLEVQKSSYSYQNEVSIKNLTKQLEEHKVKEPTTEQMKYYDFIELRNVVSDVTESFQRLQSLAAKKELIEILFSQLFVGENPLIGVKPIMPPSAYAHTTQAPAVMEAKELKALLQKFVPYLFQKIYVKRDMDILKISFKPTGLFLLLNDSEEQKKGQTHSLPNPLPSGPLAPSDTELGGNGLESFSAHHAFSSQ